MRSDRATTAPVAATQASPASPTIFQMRTGLRYGRERRRRHPGPGRRSHPDRRPVAVPRLECRRPRHPAHDQRAGQPRGHGGDARRPAPADVARRARPVAARRLDRQPPPRRPAPRPRGRGERLGAPVRPAGLAAPAVRPSRRTWRTPCCAPSPGSTGHRSRTARLRRWLGGRLRRRMRRPSAALETAYCAEVVAATYQAMGLLPADRPPNWYDPGTLLERRRPGPPARRQLGDEIEVLIPAARAGSSRRGEARTPVHAEPRDDGSRTAIRDARASLGSGAAATHVRGGGDGDDVGLPHLVDHRAPVDLLDGGRSVTARGGRARGPVPRGRDRPTPRSMRSDSSPR